MRRSMNKLVQKIIEDWMIGKTDSIKINNRDGYTSKEINVFQNLEEKKRVIGYLNSKGLDAFKRGTKMPELIRLELEKTTWDQAMQGTPMGRSPMWD